MSAPQLHPGAIPIVRVPALVAVIARCPECGQTNNALVTGGGDPKLTPSKCTHAISATLTPPEIVFSETGE